MKNVLVFGIGKLFEANKDNIYKKYNVVGLVSNDINHNKKDNIYAPNKICDIKYDEILIMSYLYYKDMVKQLKSLNIPNDKINMDFVFLEYKIDKVFINDDYDIIAYNKGIKIVVDSKESIPMLNEISVLEEYNVEGIEDAVIIDIGMNIGTTSLYFAFKNYVERVYSFEPFEKTYLKALKNFKLNDKCAVNKITHHNYGLGVRDEKRIIKNYYFDFCGCNSTVKENNNNEFSKTSEHMKVYIKNAANEIDNIVKENLNKKIICKIDTEGSEYEIFDVLTDAIIKKIDLIILEYHIVDGRNKEEIKCILRKNKFCIFDNDCSADVGLIRAVNLSKS